MTKQIYVSQPDPTAKLELNNGIKRHITRKLRSTDYRLIKANPVIESEGLLMNRALVELLIKSDLVLFTQDWKNSARCRLERQICDGCGIEYIDI